MLVTGFLCVWMGYSVVSLYYFWLGTIDAKELNVAMRYEYLTMYREKDS